MPQLFPEHNVEVKPEPLTDEFLNYIEIICAIQSKSNEEEAKG